ncbi:MAG: DUF2461 domain-containing protein [Bacteroidota bacterium]
MIEKDTLKFLKELSKNNNREWFDENRGSYIKARDNFRAFVEDLIDEIIDFDPDLIGIEGKKAIFRLFRDVRFSKNKDPYKTNFGASLSKGGRKSPYAGYYIHLSPDGNFFGGGSYRPEAAELKKIRAYIETNAADLHAITSDKKFQELFGNIQGDSLKTAPKGYPKDHPEIELLRMKGFYVMTSLPTAELTQEGLAQKVAEKLKVMHPLVEFLNEAISQ